MLGLFQFNKKRAIPAGRQGFTLIEAVMSTFILSVGVLAAFGVIQMITGFTSEISSRLQAVYLAQEGIENIRNIRDSNWLGQRDNPSLSWDQGISTADWETIDKFQRKIIISKPQANEMAVSVQVNWPGPGGNVTQVTADTELYNWK